MLNLEQILQIYPPHLHQFKRFLLREYLQCKILSILFEEAAMAQKLCFLGGTCLRLVHGTNRFSEDLDFDNFDLSDEVFVTLTNQIKVKLEEEGYEVEIRNVFKGAFRCYVRFPNLLFPLGLSGHPKEKIMIQVDTQAQHFDFEPLPFLLQKLDVFTEIFITPPDILLAQKFYAIFNRNRSKGRDFYDIVFLLGKVTPNFKYLEQKMGISSSKELKQKIKEVCKNISLTEMAEDVKPFLFNPKDVQKVTLFDRYIEQTL